MIEEKQIKKREKVTEGHLYSEAVYPKEMINKRNKLEKK